MSSTQELAEYMVLRKTPDFKRFLFWMDKIVEAEKEVNKASMRLTSNMSAEVLNSLHLNGKRDFIADGETVESYQKAVADYCKIHNNLFALLEKLENKYPAIFLTKDGLERKMGLIQQKELYLKILGEFIPVHHQPMQ